MSKVPFGNMNQFTLRPQLYESPHFPAVSPNLAFLTLKTVCIKMSFNMSLFSKERVLMLEHRTFQVNKFKSTLLLSALTATPLLLLDRKACDTWAITTSWQWLTVGLCNTSLKWFSNTQEIFYIPRLSLFGSYFFMKQLFSWFLLKWCGIQINVI